MSYNLFGKNSEKKEQGSDISYDSQIKNLKERVDKFVQGKESLEDFLTIVLTPMFDVEDNLYSEIGNFVFDCTKVIPRSERKNIVLFLPLYIDENSPKWMQEGEPLTLSRWRKIWGKRKKENDLPKNNKLPKKKLKSKLRNVFGE